MASTIDDMKLTLIFENILFCICVFFTSCGSNSVHDMKTPEHCLFTSFTISDVQSMKGTRIVHRNENIARFQVNINEIVLDVPYCIWNEGAAMNALDSIRIDDIAYSLGIGFEDAVDSISRLSTRTMEQYGRCDIREFVYDEKLGEFAVFTLSNGEEYIFLVDSSDIHVNFWKRFFHDRQPAHGAWYKY